MSKMGKYEEFWWTYEYGLIHLPKYLGAYNLLYCLLMIVV